MTTGRQIWSAKPNTTRPLAPFGVVTLAPSGSEGTDYHLSAFRWAQTANYGVLPVRSHQPPNWLRLIPNCAVVRLFFTISVSDVQNVLICVTACFSPQIKNSRACLHRDPLTVEQNPSMPNTFAAQVRLPPLSAHVSQICVPVILGTERGLDHPLSLCRCPTVSAS